MCFVDTDISGTNCLTVNFTNQPNNSVARLHSPWMCATRQNASLSFKYAIAGSPEDEKCPLSVHLTWNSNSKSTVWKSSGATGTWFRPGNVEILHPDCPFKIVFEAQKLKHQPCGINFDEINLAEVMFEGVAPPSPYPPTSTATATEVTTIAVDTTVSNTDESTGEAAVRITTSFTVTPDGMSSQRQEVTSASPASGFPTGGGHNVGTNHAYTPDGELTGSLPGTTSLSRATPAEGEYENTMPTPDNLHTTPITVGLESTSTPLNYESPARTSPQDTNYTTLSTGRTSQSVSAPDTYEPLMTRVEPTDYTALTSMGTNQSTAAPENYEPLTMRHSTTGDYTALTTRGFNQPASPPENYETLLSTGLEHNTYTTLIETENQV
ncbi:hypothetical protein BaRGS_00036655 [Batillaria attramentaria]|uniref:MAM domain-containing protein n=1 Tax=Batillaria attramentaria TaxID=370345 RepID=A0ABD0JAZ9_9CAEN